ncbi:hypothetical protein [Nocardia beijingensis]|nr:hypothetical protein [Nocardia beijingensis]
MTRMPGALGGYDVVGSAALEQLADGLLAEVPPMPEWPGMIGPV